MMPRLARVRLAIAALAVPVVLASCSDGTGPIRGDAIALARAKVAWAAQGPARYTLVVRPVCMACRRSIRLTVVNRAVITRVNVDDGTPVVAGVYDNIATVDAMLATIDQALRDHAADLDVTYDSRGVPVNVMIDWNANSADEEFGWVVTELTPTP
jgi:hypothetical protein